MQMRLEIIRLLRERLCQHHGSSVMIAGLFHPHAADRQQSGQSGL